MRLNVRSILPIVALLVALVPAVAFGSSAARVVLPADTLESAVLNELNVARVENGLRPLRPDARLAAAAEQHSVEMVGSGYFGHESSDGGVFWKRIKRFYGPRATRKTWIVGENLLWQTERVTAQVAVRAWLRSPEHRENLLQPHFRDVGIAAVRAARAPGVFAHRRVVVLTVDFGAR
jgi:uncharacterized protein YkwD